MTTRRGIINDIVFESHSIKELFFNTHITLIERAVDCIVRQLRSGNKILLCGNGGSAADAQHIAAEFVGRFTADRKPLPAIALTTDTSALTAIGNDYGYDQVFSRQVNALGNPGDVLIAISTSGNSWNILKAMIAANANGMHIIGFSGEAGGMGFYSNFIFHVPSSVTARIQETHIMLGHIICELVDREMFPEIYK